MPDVIDHQKLQRNILATWSMPDIFEGIAIDSADERRQLRIIGLPELNDFQPRTILIMLYANPRVLIITGQIDRRYQLQPYEPLVVVCGGIDQMSQHLLPRPLTRRARSRSCRFADLFQAIDIFDFEQ